MNSMKHALMKRKGDLEKNFKVTIELGKDDDKDKVEDEKKMDLAPTVDDQDPAKKALNPKLEPDDDKLARGEDDKEPMEDPAIDEELSEGPEHLAHLQQVLKGMPELPNGRAPMTLGEKASDHMQKDIKNIKMKRK